MTCGLCVVCGLNDVYWIFWLDFIVVLIPYTCIKTIKKCMFYLLFFGILCDVIVDHQLQLSFQHHFHLIRHFPFRFHCCHYHTMQQLLVLIHQIFLILHQILYFLWKNLLNQYEIPHYFEVIVQVCHIIFTTKQQNRTQTK